MPEPLSRPPVSARTLFPGDGPASRAMRELDWAATPLGPVESWPAELVAAVRTVLPSASQQLILWGPQLVQIYNDAYAELIGDRHPAAAGQPVADFWTEAWSAVGPSVEQVLAGSAAIFAEDRLLLTQRNGYLEETYWTFSFSAIRDDAGQVGGIYVATRETSDRVIDTRRFETLARLGEVSLTEAESVQASARALIDVLAGNRGSVPAGVVYLIDDGQFRPAAWFGLGDTVPVPLSDGHPLAAVRGDGNRVIDELNSLDVAAGLQPGPLGEALPHTSLAMPLRARAGTEPIGLLWLAANPYRQLDERYRSFLELIGRQIAVALSDARAYHRRNELARTLTERDGRKTRFLQDVSHELRTPLTLLLGPLTEALELAQATPRLHEDLEIVHRAAQHLRRLVEALLQGARAEASRLGAGVEALSGEPELTDLAGYTAELAGMFRSAAEDAGLALVVDVGSDPLLTSIDRGVWSEIVLNLLSNAIKFTEHGSVTIQLRHEGDSVRLTVSDTGVGIPEADRSKVFQRFHQVSPALTAADEGAGIGLSLVAELVEVLGGTVELRDAAVELPEEAAELSEPAAEVPERAGAGGSSFVVTIPLPEPSSSSTARAAGDPAADPRTADPTRLPVTHDERPTGRIMLVENDPDLRGYLSRLLSEDGWVVDAAPDVMSALAAATTPDLVLTDVVLPGTSGTEFVQMLRADPALARLPVILLSGQAGPQAVAEGLRAGADDYIVKPFEAEELLARVRVHRELAVLREQAARQAEEKVASLQIALTTNRHIGTAIGILMSVHRVTADEAFAMLRVASQAQHRKLRDIADEVNLTGALEPSVDDAAG